MPRQGEPIAWLTGEAAACFSRLYDRWVASGYRNELSPYLNSWDELEARWRREARENLDADPTA
ncbi:MAG: hypothetical protein OXE79_05500 [Acidimicrobiaceae bacterium]|nr:hypothetical protein [Acidimicrobiaceae bacterium]MCY4175079.1 hypothetical protein [Acidimicrobiaceae bacterium]MCY4279764.1 hypothetical protein [Acidimicrobiaceae bacterium]